MDPSVLEKSKKTFSWAQVASGKKEEEKPPAQATQSNIPGSLLTKPIQAPVVTPSQEPVPDLRGIARGPGVDPEVARRGYPLGFNSLEDWRDRTRPYAEQNRGGQVITRGSAVTNLSQSRQVPFDAESDIDMGLVSRDLLNDSRRVKKTQYGKTGFPQYGSDLSDVEIATSDRNNRERGHTMGVKIFGNSPGGAYLERPHTPPRQRRNDQLFK